MASTSSGSEWVTVEDSTIRVLHVDDSPGMLELTATALERESDRFSVRSATDPEAALEADLDDIDCLVLDYEMPGTDGIEVLEAVRERDPDLPVILFTGKGSEEVASEAISAGVTDYIQKGGSADRYTLLANRIRNAVDRYRAERKIREVFEAVELVDEGVSILDRNGEFAYVNRAYADVFDTAPSALVGEHWSALYRDDEDVRRMREEVLASLGEESATWTGETLMVRPDGTSVRTSHTLAYTVNGKLICIVRNPREADADGPLLS